MERRSHYETQEARQYDNWNNRFGKPMPAPAPGMQRDIDFAHAIDSAHATGNPVALLEAQMAAMPQAAQIEVRASLPFTAIEFEA